MHKLAANAAVALLMLESVYSVAHGQSLLEEVRVNHNATVQAIHNFSCKVRVKCAAEGGALDEVGEYWKSANKIRVRGSIGAEKFDALQSDSVVKTIGTRVFSARRQEQVGAISPAIGRCLPGCNVWELGLFLFPSPGKVFMMVSFDELLQREHTLKSVKRQQDVGKEYVVICFAHQEPTHTTEWEIWFDPTMNYLASRLVVRQSGLGNSSSAPASTEQRVIITPS